MPHINQIKKSNFLKKEDCGQGILVTIRDCIEQNVAKEGAPEELKWCLLFDETEKPMVLNSTNAQIIAAVCGSEETEHWEGKKIVLFADPTISFGGKLVGGIRARAPRGQAAKAAAPAPAPAKTAPAAAPAEPEEDLPF